MTEKSNLKVVREKEYWLSPIALSSFQAPLPSEIEVRKYKMFFPVAQEMKNGGRLERATRRIVEEAKDGDQGPRGLLRKWADRPGRTSDDFALKS